MAEVQDGHQDAPLVNGNSTADPNSASLGVQTAPTSPKSPHIDTDAQAQVISSLRGQIQDLFSQVTQLNNKLVKSYDRVSDLEDDLHVTSSNLRASTLKVSQLELERTQHLSALSTGLLVEKANVTAELTRLMEKATEEAAQRGQAESARIAIEKDLDDLSANLFDQANTMVAEARYGRSLSERKAEEAELALKSAEEAVASMQKQMQALQEERERAERSRAPWADGTLAVNLTRAPRLLSSHQPYQDFLLFVAHLRSIHLSSQYPPGISTLLPLPFLARLRPSDPTVRLDLAPSLNWLSRRSVMAAIHNAQLTIEPVSTSYLLQEATSPSGATNVPGLNSSGNNFSCALCGTFILPASPSSPGRHPTHPSQQNTNSWSSSLFKRPSFSSSISSSSPPTSPPSKGGIPPPLPLTNYPHTVYVFRVYSAVSPTMTMPTANLPSISSIVGPNVQQPPQHPHHQHTPSTASTSSTASLSATTTYPLCTSGWCLKRLRVTCSLWSFVRTGIVDKIWEEEIPNLISPAPAPGAASTTNGVEKPPVPPRRRGLWGMASVLSEKAAATWGDGDKNKKVQKPASEVPPPVPPRAAAAAPPPPLPKRSEDRARTAPTTPQVPLADPIATAASPKDEKAEATAEKQEEDSSEKKDVVPPAVSPVQIPLPESRPSTPSPVVDTAATPSRSASPARPARPLSMGANPPPIPRRAAARAAPAPTNAASSRPGTPTIPEKAKEEEVKEKPAEGEGDSSPVAPKEEEAKTEENVPQPAEPQAAETAPTEPLVVNGDSHAEASAKPESDDSATTPTAEEKPTIERVDSPVEDSQSVVNGNSDDLDKDTEVYIGDATWEERTWKEVIKLKEEMFWARVGGFR